MKFYKVLYIRASAHDHIGTKNMKRMTSSQGDKIRTVHKICCEFSWNRICTILATGVLKGGSSVGGLVLVGSAVLSSYPLLLTYRLLCAPGASSGSPLLISRAVHIQHLPGIVGQAGHRGVEVEVAGSVLLPSRMLSGLGAWSGPPLHRLFAVYRQRWEMREWLVLYTRRPAILGREQSSFSCCSLSAHL